MTTETKGCDCVIRWTTPQKDKNLWIHYCDLHHTAPETAAELHLLKRQHAEAIDMVLEVGLATGHANSSAELMGEVLLQHQEIRDRLLAIQVELLEALKQISEPMGVYSRDREQYLKNCLDTSVDIAQAAVAKAQGG